MTFSAAWVSGRTNLSLGLRNAIQSGLHSYGEEDCVSFEFTDGVAVLELVSERSSETLKDIIFETLLNNFTSIHESDFDIEIDLDVDFEESDN
jgi:hypothetical protein